MSPASRSAAAVVVALVATLSAAGCSKSIDNVPEKNAIRREAGVIGTPVDYFGLSAAVLRIEPADQSPEGFPRLLVTVRSENKRSAPWQNPTVMMHCDESKDGGDWFDTSTWEPNAGMPAGQVAEGQVLMSFPSKTGASRYPVATCTNAKVVFTGTNPADREQAVITSYAVDTTTVQAALDAERGH